MGLDCRKCPAHINTYNSLNNIIKEQSKIIREQTELIKKIRKASRLVIVYPETKI